MKTYSPFRSASYYLRKMVEAECAKAGVHPQVVLEMSSPEGILQAVAEGTGATILPELYVRSRLPGMDLQVIDLYDPTPRHAVGLAYLTKRHRGLGADGVCSDLPHDDAGPAIRPRTVQAEPANKACSRAEIASPLSAHLTARRSNERPAATLKVRLPLG